MPCLSPIWIRNRRYFDKKNPCRDGSDVAKSALALRPWDIARQWLMVPCGKCEECLRCQRNNWFVRLERELARCKAESQQAIFITITIAPKYYEEALRNPSIFIRRWNERVRHRLGHSFKHAFFRSLALTRKQDWRHVFTFTVFSSALIAFTTISDRPSVILALFGSQRVRTSARGTLSNMLLSRFILIPRKYLTKMSF